MKRITYLELLQMVKQGTNPEVITYRSDKYTFQKPGYFGHNCTLEASITAWVNTLGLATDPVIEYEPQVLSIRERQFLSAMIKPFKDRNCIIEKYQYPGENNMYEYIRVTCDSFIGGRESTALPLFEKGTMYRGMHLEHRYTPEELKL